MEGGFDETLACVARVGERLSIKLRGKPIAALIPVTELDYLEAQEDARDAEKADDFMKAFRENGSVGKPIDGIIQKHGTESGHSRKK